MSKVVPEEDMEEVRAAADRAVLLKIDQVLRGAELSDQYDILGISTSLLRKVGVRGSHLSVVQD